MDILMDVRGKKYYECAKIDFGCTKQILDVQNRFWMYKIDLNV